MTMRRSPFTVGIVLALSAMGSNALAQATQTNVEARLKRLEQRQAEYERELEARDSRIRELEAQLETQPPAGGVAPAAQLAAPATAAVTADQPAPAVRPVTSTAIASADTHDDQSPFGLYSPGKGFTVAKNEWGEVQLSIFSYIRYLNQTNLDKSYFNYAGIEKSIDPRHDIQLNKVFLYTRGWFIDPRFNYAFQVWSTGTGLGTDTNNLVAGSLGFDFNPAFKLGLGVSSMPSTRSLEGQFPYWHRVDNRLIADEFMRGGFTQGIWANGQIAKGLDYKVMLGNNLSAFGVSASQLDSTINTMGASLVWMPSTGEFGPRAGFGDYEYHENLASLFSIHYTRSTEDKQSQPSETAPENTQIRLSDGTTLFTPGALAPGVTVNKLDYQMVAMSAGMKYRGFYLEAEVYRRWLGNFRTDGAIPLSSMTDNGMQVTTSMMAVPNQVQIYANTSKVFGNHGNPWDAGIGINWWPFKKRGFRINSEAIYLRNSPVGSNLLPYQVGSNGWIFVTNAELAF